MQNLEISKATINDTELLITLIHELAEYEKATDRIEVTADKLIQCMFTEQPFAHAHIAYLDEEPVGYAIYFYNYSSYLAKPGIYLEDLYVKPNLRGKSIGKAILAQLAKQLQEKDYGFITWNVLKWNTPAIEFYDHIGAVPADCKTYKLAGDALQKLADLAN